MPDRNRTVSIFTKRFKDVPAAGDKHIFERKGDCNSELLHLAVGLTASAAHADRALRIR